MSESNKATNNKQKMVTSEGLDENENYVIDTQEQYYSGNNTGRNKRMQKLNEEEHKVQIIDHLDDEFGSESYREHKKSFKTIDKINGMEIIEEYQIK